MRHWTEADLDSFSQYTRTDLLAVEDFYYSHYNSWPETQSEADRRLAALILLLRRKYKHYGIDFLEDNATLPELRRRMRDGVIEASLLGSLLVVDDDPMEMAVVSGFIFAELIFLNRFVQQIESGSQPKNGNIARRAAMYAGAAWATKEGYKEHVYSQRKKAIYVKNILGYADHCRGCLAETAKGLQPIGFISLPGKRDCRSNCFCHLRYYTGMNQQIRA